MIIKSNFSCLFNKLIIKMGCGYTKEKVQTEILVIQLEKAEIQEERERLIHRLETLTGKKYSIQPITDYIDSKINNISGRNLSNSRSDTDEISRSSK